MVDRSEPTLPGEHNGSDSSCSYAEQWASFRRSGATTCYAVFVSPGAERVAMLNLANQRFSCLCPFATQTIRHARQAKTVLRAGCPGFVFAGVTRDSNRWQAINGTRGVRFIAMDGSEPRKFEAQHVHEAYVSVLSDMPDSHGDQRSRALMTMLEGRRKLVQP